MQQKGNKVKHFWASYQDAVVDSGVPDAMAKWYVNWAKKFAVSIKGKPLRLHSADDVRKFLTSLENEENLEP